MMGRLLAARWVMTGAALLLATATAAEATPEKRRYTFQVGWSVLPDLKIASGDLSLEQEGGSYLVTMRARANLTVPRIDWRGVFATQGDLLETGARSPARFERASIRPEVREDVFVTWDGSETPTTFTRRSPEGAQSAKRDPVDPAQIANVVDPLTFALKLLDNVSASDGESCELSQKTWDGARLSVLEVRTGAGLPGNHIECNLVYRSISGLRADNPWRTAEEKVQRTVRFEKFGGRWDPVSVRIAGTFVGFDSVFETKLTRASGS